MINDKELIKELKLSLKRERCYTEVTERDSVLDSLVFKIDNVDIFYLHSKQCLNSIKFLKDKAFIIWDAHYWEVFYNYLLQVENCKRNEKNIIQGIIGVITGFLGDKYSNNQDVSAFLKSIQSIYGTSIKLHQDIFISVKGRINICKLFSFYHEIGHMEYVKNNNDTIVACKELVLDLFSSLSKETFDGLEIWSDLGWDVVNEVRNHKRDLLLEEITSDVYAVMLVADFYKKFPKINKFKLACDIIIAIEYLTSFQNLFNIINRAWDAHFAEIKYNVPVRRHEIDNFINEVEIVRNGIGNLILAIVIQKIFYLDKCQCDLLWKHRDDNHVDNLEIISCLADDEFICTAIKEALK